MTTSAELQTSVTSTFSYRVNPSISSSVDRRPREYAVLLPEGKTKETQEREQGEHAQDNPGRHSLRLRWAQRRRSRANLAVVRELNSLPKGKGKPKQMFDFPSFPVEVQGLPSLAPVENSTDQPTWWMRRVNQPVLRRLGAPQSRKLSKETQVGSGNQPGDKGGPQSHSLRRLLVHAPTPYSSSQAASVNSLTLTQRASLGHWSPRAQLTASTRRSPSATGVVGRWMPRWSSSRRGWRTRTSWLEMEAVRQNAHLGCESPKRQTPEWMNLVMALRLQTMSLLRGDLLVYSVQYPLPQASLLSRTESMSECRLESKSEKKLTSTDSHG